MLKQIIFDSMRHIKFLSCILAFFATISCTKEESGGNSTQELKDLSFTCKFLDEDEPVTSSQKKSFFYGEETSDEKKLVHWHPGDKITIVPSTVNNENVNAHIGDIVKGQYFQTVDGGRDATFTGKLVEADSYIGIYPVAEWDFIDTDQGFIYKNFFDYQTACENNIAKEQIVGLSKTTDKNLTIYFYNACCVIQFTIGEELTNITKASFRGAKGEAIAGRHVIYFKVDEGSEEPISVNFIERYMGQKSKATICLANADYSAFIAGATYYMSCAPSTLENGFSIVLHSSDGKKYAKSTTNSNSLYRSKIFNLGTFTSRDTKFHELSPRTENLYLFRQTDIETKTWATEKMFRHSIDKFHFRFGGIFNQGQFKFLTQEGVYTNSFKALEGDNSDCFTCEDAMFVAEDDRATDFKWFLTDKTGEGVACQIVVDITQGIEKMYITKFEDYVGVWMMGDATPNGWDADNPTALTKTGNYTYSWTGSLGTGELKFTLDKDAKFDSKEWFMAPTSGQTFTTGENQDLLYMNLTSYPGIDQKWHVTEEGEYTITINTLTEKMSVTKNSTTEQTE